MQSVIQTLKIGRHEVSTWYDRRSCNWFTQLKDEAGNQIGDASIDGTRASVAYSFRDAIRRALDIEMEGATSVQKVAFMNSLRSIVGRRSPRNKSGAPLVSDFDLVTATVDEKAEAFAAFQKSNGRGETLNFRNV